MSESMIPETVDRGEALGELASPPPGYALPKRTDDFDTDFMTQLLRHRGLIDEENEVVSQEFIDVGMTAGYFSEIKKIKCTYKEETDAPSSFVVKTWPRFELLPKENLRAMFLKDIKSYLFPQERFFPRPQAYLAVYEEENDICTLVMEDAEAFSEHKVHEREMNFEDVMLLIPKLVDIAVEWEGCHQGEKARQLEKLGVDLWTSDRSIATLKFIMPAGAKLLDRMLEMESSSLVGSPTWDTVFGKPGMAELLSRKIDSFYGAVKPENGATCTLAHGDLRGDNIFIQKKENGKDSSDWLCIDFQLLFRGPIPSDLAYLMNSASVLPEVYTGDNLKKILRSFYDQFMLKTKLYKDYTYERFEHEFAVMSTVLFIYYVGFGGEIWRTGAFKNKQPARVELGGRGAEEADLTPEDLRKRMWWRKTFANFREIFLAFHLYEELKGLPDTLEGLGDWVELPDHLK